jgi:hypothetical protein
MLKHWDKLLATNCRVVGIKDYTVYPIFRVGSTSLNAAADREYVNEDIGVCKHIDVVLRDPEERFVSGLNEYSTINSMDIKKVWRLVEQGRLIDRHFCPQYIWLLHLYKFYRGEVTLRSFDFIHHITDIHKRKYGPKKQKIPILKEYVEIDQRIMQHIGHRIELKKIIEEHRHALS